MRSVGGLWNVWGRPVCKVLEGLGVLGVPVGLVIVVAAAAAPQVIGIAAQPLRGLQTTRKRNGR